MFRFTIRTVLIVGIAWLSAVIGALIGEVAANNRIAVNSLPRIGNLLFAVTWGGTVGVIPSLGCAALLADRGHVAPRIRWLWAVWLVIALTSGISLYVFVINTADI
jgi:hypothetical protein